MVGRTDSPSYGCLIREEKQSTLIHTKRWEQYPLAPADFIAQGNEHPILLQVLYNRGVRSVTEISAFLNGEDAIQEDPYKLADMEAAVERILHALKQRQVICVYGDFDADGVTATALLVEALQAAGGRVGAYIPDRVDEGYGLNVDSIEERIAGKADLLITVDCGIRSVAEVAVAMQRGVDVIVTDHHSLGRELPPALAVINPQRAEDPRLAERLAGVGVAYRLAQAVLRAAAGQPWCKLSPEAAAELEQTLLDLVALGTVADMLPLIGENRSLVRRGLAEIRKGKRVGLYALMERAAVVPQAVDSTAISFRIAPRINAAGRLSHAKLAYDLLRSRDFADAFDRAAQLETLNDERRARTLATEREADQQLASLPDHPSLIFVASDQFQYGIVGLVAGRLSDRYYRPAVAVMQGESEARGSARQYRRIQHHRRSGRDQPYACAPRRTQPRRRFYGAE